MPYASTNDSGLPSSSRCHCVRSNRRVPLSSRRMAWSTPSISVNTRPPCFGAFFWCILCLSRACRKPCYHRNTTPRGRRSLPYPHAAPGWHYTGHLSGFSARATNPEDVFVFDRCLTVCRTTCEAATARKLRERQAQSTISLTGSLLASGASSLARNAPLSP